MTVVCLAFIHRTGKGGDTESTDPAGEVFVSPLRGLIWMGDRQVPTAVDRHQAQEKAQRGAHRDGRAVGQAEPGASAIEPAPAKAATA